MKAQKIQKSDVKDMLIASLPTRPTAPKSLGGMGYGAGEMKNAFDKLPLYIIERYNELIEDIGDLGEDSLAAAMPSGIKEGHTLADLFTDIASGAMASYFTFLDKTLTEHVREMREELARISTELEKLTKKEEKE